MAFKNLTYTLLYLYIGTSFTHCITSKLKVDKQALNKYLENSETFKNSFTGFSLYDPNKEAYLFNYNDDKYFTPASNTKLFTLYAGKKIFEDSIPGIKYTIQNDSLYFTGTGDPTFLDSDFPTQPVFEFLKASSKTLAYCKRSFKNERFGPGWAWDDYMYYFSPEKSSMPIYSNVLQINRLPENKSFSVSPIYFGKSIIHFRDSLFKTTRLENENIFKVYYNQLPDSIDRKVPFKYSSSLFVKLLSDTIRKPVYQSLQYTPEMTHTLNSQHIDSVMKKMMVESDNFMAEQILIMGSGFLFDTLDSEMCISYAIDTFFPELRKQIDWVDGSGLSRYNKFTPHSITVLLRKIYTEIPKETIITLFPKGGVSGTLKNNFKNEVPYIIAKTGSMKNVYNLSGFLITKKGQWLVFSFMNNNFEVLTTQVKSEMEKILNNIYFKF